jgi:hypothetical protein
MAGGVVMSLCACGSHGCHKELNLWSMLLTGEGQASHAVCWVCVQAVHVTSGWEACHKSSHTQ